MIKTIKKHTILENDFYKIENNQVIFKNKKEGYHLKITHKPNNKGIAVLPITSNFDVIIQDEFRYGINKFITQVVKGGANKSETFEEAAKKEISEELNLTFDELIDMGCFYENPSVFDNENRAFIAINCVEKNNKILNDGTESFSNKRTVPFDEILSKCLNNEIECAVTQMLILKASHIREKIKKELK